MAQNLNQRTLPNFVIGGAPKSGTTAMANYLRDHAQVFVSDVKEPFYFATDMPGMAQSSGIDTESAYVELFRDATANQLAVGEGSTLYLYSDTAIENALAFNPAMKFLFMIRRPAEIAHAYHMQMRFHEYEEVDDFQEAWDLQDSREKGETTYAPRCREPKLLLYRDVAAIGTQLQRAFDLIPKEQRHVIVFDDFVSDVQSSYRQACGFLDIPDDGRSQFAKENAAMQSRIPQVTRLLRSAAVVSLTRFLKRRLDGSVYALARRFKHSLMFRNAPRDRIDPEFDAALHQFFLEEVEQVETLLQRDLTEWKTPRQPKAVV